MAKIGSIEVQEGLVCADAHIELVRWLAIKDGNLQAVFSIVRANKRAEFMAAKATAEDVAAGKFDEGEEVAAAKAAADQAATDLASATSALQDAEAAVLAVGIKLQAARNDGKETPEMEAEHAALAKAEGPIAAAYISARYALPQAEQLLLQAVEARKQQAEQESQAALESAEKGALPVAEISVVIPEVRGQDVRADAWAELLKQRPDVAAMDDTE